MYMYMSQRLDCFVINPVIYFQSKFYHTDIGTCTEEIVMVAGGVFGVMCLIIISLITLLLAQVCKRYDRDCALGELFGT